MGHSGRMCILVVMLLGAGLDGRAAAQEEKLPDHLSTSDVKEGIQAIKPKVMACAKNGETGKVVVKFTITGRGTVGSAVVEGNFAGTALGSCVEEAVKQARFKRWKGPSMSVKYPFVFK